MKRLLPLAGLLGLLWAGQAHAACTLPYILQNGTIPNATQVMADFYALLNCINTGTPGTPGGPPPAVVTCTSSPGSCPFSVPMFWPGIPPANQVVRISFADPVTCPANLPSSGGSAKTAATGSTVVNIYQVHAGTPTLEATATFAPSGSTPTYTASSSFSFAVGDVVQYQFPATPDATMADVSLTMHCFRTGGTGIGASGAPLADGNIWVGNSLGVATPVVPSGDVSMTDAGVFTVLKIHGTTVPASPTAGQALIATSGTAAVWSLVGNANLVNSSTIVNGQTCTLGSTCTLPGASVSLTIGGTAISGGTNGFILYNNNGVLGNLNTAGSGNVVLANTPITTVNGMPCILGSFCTVTASATSITVGTTTIVNSTSGHILYNNGGILGDLTTTGTGSVVLGTTPTFTTSFKLLGSSTGATTFTSANAGSSNFTLTIPAVTDTAAVLGTAQTWTATQSSTPQTLTISGSTFTPAAASGNNIKFTLVHASCPCTLANPSGSPVAGTSGVIEVTQSATGSDTIGTWGSSYLSAGGTATITLSTGANATDTLSYYVRDSTHIVLTTAALNATH